MLFGYSRFRVGAVMFVWTFETSFGNSDLFLAVVVWSAVNWVSNAFCDFVETVSQAVIMSVVVVVSHRLFFYFTGRVDGLFVDADLFAVGRLEARTILTFSDVNLSIKVLTATRNFYVDF